MMVNGAEEENLFAFRFSAWASEVYSDEVSRLWEVKRARNQEVACFETGVMMQLIECMTLLMIKYVERNL